MIIMETYDNIYETICRLCLLRGDSDNMVSLIDNNSENGLSIYGKAVKTFAQVTIEKNDCLPKTMCAKCLILLKHIIHFKFTCELSDKQLWNIKNNNQTDVSVLKQKVVEFIMFKQLFPEEISQMSSSCAKKCRKELNKVENVDEKRFIPEIVSKETSDDHFDFSPLDWSDSDRKSPKREDDDILIQKIESIVKSSTLCINSDFKHRKRRKKVKFLKSRPPRQPKQGLVKKGEYVCSVCNKVLANKHTFHCHMQRHKGYRFICEHCGKGFPTLPELQSHQVSRHGTGPYLQCQHCPFKAPRRHDLIEHERIHTGERPFACDKCGLTFRRRAIWKKHLIYHSEKKVQCNLCPRKFYQRSEMLAHSNNVHDRMYVYSCCKCGAIYTKTATVRRHMTEKHGIPRDMQGKVIRINKGRSVIEQ